MSGTKSSLRGGESPTSTTTFLAYGFQSILSIAYSHAPRVSSSHSPPPFAVTCDRKSDSFCGDSVSGWISIFSPLPPNTMMPTRAMGTSRGIDWMSCAIFALTSSIIRFIEPVPDDQHHVQALAPQFPDEPA